ncbi:MAG: hypothetical protein P4L50_25420 [Anaerolineaceae bacterium]|nr:hypothetical protein [Anaerolineaceae bacterium]
MSKRKGTSQNAISLLVAVAILAFGFATFGGQISPAYADSPTPTVAPAGATTPLIIPNTGGYAYPGKIAAVEAYFVTSMAQQMGISTTKFQAAYFAASRQTIQLAQSAGMITDVQAKNATSEIGDLYSYNMVILYHDWDPFPWNQYLLYPKLLRPDDLISALHTTGLILTTDLREGKPAADIAAENNLDLSVVEQAIMASVSKRITNYTVFGKLLTTSQQNADLLQIKNLLPYILNRKLPAYYFTEKDNSLDLIH